MLAAELSVGEFPLVCAVLPLSYSYMSPYHACGPDVLCCDVKGGIR